MLLGEIFPEKTIKVGLESEDKDELFEEMVEVLHLAHPELDRAEALAELKSREEKMSTGIMHLVAVPHAEVKSLKGTIGAIGISRSGIDYESLDKAPVYIVFMLVAGPGETERHIQILKKLAGILMKKDFVAMMQKCTTAHEVYELISQAESGD